jgi:hypothetical protein
MTVSAHDPDPGRRAGEPEETAHLLRLPKNAARLLSVLVRSVRGKTPATESY